MTSEPDIIIHWAEYDEPHSVWLILPEGEIAYLGGTIPAYVIGETIVSTISGVEVGFRADPTVRLVRDEQGLYLRIDLTEMPR